MQVRNYTRLPALRYLGFCNVLHIIMVVSGPSQLIESTNSMIIIVGIPPEGECCMLNDIHDHPTLPLMVQLEISRVAHSTSIQQ